MPRLSPLVVRERYDAGIKAIRDELNDYWMNHSFFEGHQWLWFNPIASRVEELPDDPERIQAVVNRMRADTRIILSKALQRDLTFEVPPSQPDSANIRAAKISESVLDSVKHTHNWESLRSRFAHGMWKGGYSALCIEWDPNAGRVVAPGENPDMTIKEGDTVEAALTPPEFVVEPGHVTPETDAMYWMRLQLLPPKVLQDMYDMEEPPAPDATSGRSSFQNKLLYEHTNSGNEAELTVVLTYYHRPCPEFEDGAVAVMVGDEFVSGPKKWPFPFRDRLNLIVGTETDNETKWTGSTPMTAARPIQVALNLAWSNLLEHLESTANARLIVASSTVDMVDEFTTLPGEVLQVPDGALAPTYMSPPQLPGWVQGFPQQLQTQLDDILGVHDISRGRAPANIESGYGLSILAEQDSTPIGRLVQETARSFGALSELVLQTYAEKVKEPREASVRTPDMPTVAYRWSGKDLKNQTRVIVPADAIMPRSKAEQMELANNMLQVGFVQSPEQWLQIAEVPGAKGLLRAINPDASKARRENHDLSIIEDRNKIPVPADFDDHSVHIMAHNTFRKSAEYEQLTQEQRDNVDVHIQGHETMAAEQAGKSRAGAAIDPLLATTPTGDGRPTLPPEALPAAPAGGPALPAGAGADAVSGLGGLPSELLEGLL